MPDPSRANDTPQPKVTRHGEVDESAPRADDKPFLEYEGHVDIPEGYWPKETEEGEYS